MRKNIRKTSLWKKIEKNKHLVKQSIFSKKGFFFSLFVLTALTLVIFTFRSNVQFKEEQRSEIFKKNVDLTNKFINDFDEDIERTLYITSFRAFLGADEYIQRTSGYLTDVNTDIPEAIMNGTIKGIALNYTNSSNLNAWLDNIRSLSSKFNINITLNNTNITVEQSSPWLVNVTLVTNVIVTDYVGVIGWNYILRKSTAIDISEANFPDPIYYLEGYENYYKNKKATPNRVLINSVRKTPYENFWFNDTTQIPAVTNASNLAEHIYAQYYRENPAAPSFFERLEGKLRESSPYGIESFVNVLNDSQIWEYSGNGTSTCAVDYQFFVGGDCGDKNRIEGINCRFMINRTTLTAYNLTGINSTNCII
jgi:hypothetical protein